MANYNIFIGIFLVLYAASQAYGQSVNCTQAGVGRFPDPTDTTCQNYVYCVFNSAANTYTGYNYVCPTTSVFNPNTRVCTAPANYACTVTTTVPTTTSIPTTTVIPTTTPIPTTTIAPTTTLAPDACTTDGFVADPTVTDCSSYIQCVQLNGTFDETTLTCPNGTFYNPTSTFCESDYVCPVATTTTLTTQAATVTTTVATTTVVTTAAPTTAAPFACTTVGRFANTADTTCQSYFYCVASNTGTFLQYQYTCPSTSVFSPTTRVCTANYVCPTS